MSLRLESATRRGCASIYLPCEYGDVLDAQRRLAFAHPRGTVAEAVHQRRWWCVWREPAEGRGAPSDQRGAAATSRGGVILKSALNADGTPRPLCADAEEDVRHKGASHLEGRSVAPSHDAPGARLPP